MSFTNSLETGRPVKIKDEGISIVNNVSSIDFAGAGVTGATIGDDVTENIPGPAVTLGDPVSIAHGGTNNTSFTEGDIPAFDASLIKLKGDNTNRRWDSVLSQMIISGFKLVVGSTINYYVSTTGLDSNDGLTIGTPKLTLDGATGVLSSLPQFGGNMYIINFANGTYQLATTGTAGYEFKPFFSVSGNSNNRSVIKLLGNVTTPANVKIQAANTSSRCFTGKGRYTLFEVDGIEFTECSGAFAVDNSQLMVTNFRVINNYAGAAFNITNLSTFTINAATGTETGLIQQKDGQNGSAITALGASGVSISQSLTVTNSGNINAFNALSGSSIIWAVNGLTTSVTGSVASRGLGGMFISQGALASLRGTYNWTNLDRSSISQVINITANGQISVPSLTAVTHNITDCKRGIVVDVGAIYASVAATDIFNYAGATPTTANRWVVTDNSVISINYTIPTADITYNASSGTNSYMGDDRRFIRRDASNVYAATSVGTDAYAIVTNPLTTALVNGMERSFIADVANTGACTLTVDATGTYSIFKKGNLELIDGDIKAGMIVVVRWDGGRWEMINPVARQRSSGIKGADVVAANDLTLGLDGDSFMITGNTQINAITTSGWASGNEFILMFSGTPTIKHNTAGGAGTAVLYLAGSVDILAAAYTLIKFYFDGTQFQEVSRKVA